MNADKLLYNMALAALLKEADMGYGMPQPQQSSDSLGNAMQTALGHPQGGGSITIKAGGGGAGNKPPPQPGSPEAGAAMGIPSLAPPAPVPGGPPPPGGAPAGGGSAMSGWPSGPR